MKTKNQNSGKKLNIELYLGIVATFIAFLSIALSVWERIEIRRHQRLSVKPILTANLSINKSASPDGTISKFRNSLTVENAGLGPAIIDSYCIYVSQNGAWLEFDSWDKILPYMGEAKLIQQSDYDPGDVFQISKSDLVYQFDSDEQDLKIGFRINYHSIYDENFTMMYMPNIPG